MKSPKILRKLLYYFRGTDKIFSILNTYWAEHPDNPSELILGLSYEIFGDEVTGMLHNYLFNTWEDDTFRFSIDVEGDGKMLQQLGDFFGKVESVPKGFLISWKLGKSDTKNDDKFVEFCEMMGRVGEGLTNKEIVVS